MAMVIRDCPSRSQCEYCKTNLSSGEECPYFWLSGRPLKASDRAKALQATIILFHSVTNLKKSR